MPRVTVVALLCVWGLAAAGRAQDHAHCPMAGPGAHREQVDARHDAATGVAHEGVVHHFALAKDGGSIRLEVRDTREAEARDRIRAHLQVIARSFGAGDFDADAHPRSGSPGTDMMKERK